MKVPIHVRVYPRKYQKMVARVRSSMPQTTKEILVDGSDLTVELGAKRAGRWTSFSEDVCHPRELRQSPRGRPERDLLDHTELTFTPKGLL